MEGWRAVVVGGCESKQEVTQGREGGGRGLPWGSQGI